MVRTRDLSAARFFWSAARSSFRAASKAAFWSIDASIRSPREIPSFNDVVVDASLVT